MYPPDAPFKVYDQEIWWSDKWDARSYGRDFDFSRPFFDQFRELQLAVPRNALVNKQSENSAFTNHSGKNKNCYWSAITFESEDIYYSDWIVEHCRDCVDCSYLLEGCELCYETYYAWGSYRAFFCEFIRRCEEVWFCFDCSGCKNCFLSCNLRNKQYCIQNEQLTPEEYRKRMAEILPLSHSLLRKLREEYCIMKERRAMHPAIFQLQSEGCSGDLLFTSKDCENCFDSIGMRDCRHCFDGIDAKDSLDVYHVGWAELMYECHAISHAFQCIACHFTYDCKNCLYSDCTQNSHDLFGCCGINQGSFCILNKQYSKEEYEALVPKIIDHMNRTGEYGEFFPMAFSPFGYNQSRALEYFPITKEQAQEEKIPWSNYEPPQPETGMIIDAGNLPERITEITDEILHSAIRCEVTGKPFRIIRQELDFYRRNGLPLPRRCPDRRYIDRFTMRKPKRLWKRNCTKCGKNIEAAFAPERPEKIYCKTCYLTEVY